MKDYDITIQSTVHIRGRVKPETYERIVTVYNAKSVIGARKAAQGTLEKGEKIVDVKQR